MGYTLKIKRYNGVEECRYSCEQVGPLEEKCLAEFDWRIADLINLFVEEEFCNSGDNGIKTEMELLSYEISCNSVNAGIIEECRGMSEQGIQISVEQIKKRCSYIWKSYLFAESTGMDFGMLQFYYKLRDNISDPDEMLFWTFRFCSWGGYDNPFPYTLYKGIIDGRFERFYDKYKADLDWFLVGAE